MHWFEIKNISSIDSPALLIYEDRVQKNIDTAIRMIGDINRLRPHVKTHKNSATTKLMLEKGISKFKCATIAEAELLARTGAHDILVSYQLVGPKLTRLLDLALKYPRVNFSCLIDSRNIAEQLSAACLSRDLVMTVYIDLNVGMNRTGIRPGQDAIDLYVYCRSLAGLNTIGLHAYDGHQRHQQFNERETAVIKSFSSVIEMKQAIKAVGIPEPFLIAGGSPSFSTHCKYDDRECSPGTFVYWDHGYAELCQEQEFVPAAVLITRIVSLPGPGKICTDLGHKSVAAENDLTKRVFFPTDKALVPVGQSEEHLVLETNENHTYEIGDLLYAIPYHICPTVALYDHLFVVRNARVEAKWKVEARNRELESMKD